MDDETAEIELVRIVARLPCSILRLPPAQLLYTRHRHHPHLAREFAYILGAVPSISLDGPERIPQAHQDTHLLV